MKSLVDGTLVIEVAMKLADPTKVKPPPFIPENPSACKLVQSMFMDEESSDVVFEVGDSEGRTMQRRWPEPHRLRFMHTDSSCINAHLRVLKCVDQLGRG